ncbi:MAG TPA: hypothetical protein VMG11_01220 [Steroidobacteraceae bacterium]|nr:hypothetical protein [Steroidobacteraceae bacterium]
MAEPVDGVPSRPEIDYERHDLALSPLGWVALALVALLALAPFIIAAGFFSSSTPDVDRRLRIAPPGPRLQINPRRDLRKYLAAQQQLLDSYGWVDRAHGIAREPIGVAMQRAVTAGFAGFPPAPQREAPE